MAFTEPYTTTDGFGPLTKGMHSGLDPLLLDSNGQFAYGVNVTTRGGCAKTRPAFEHLGKLGAGSFQGAKEYSLDEADHLAFCISGVVHVRSGLTGEVTEITGHRLSASAESVHFTQVYRWMVVQDGVSRPVVVEESGGEFRRVPRDAVVDGPVPSDSEQSPWIALAVGTVGAYAHGRYHFVPRFALAVAPALEEDPTGQFYVNADAIPEESSETGRACFVSSDVLDPLEPMRVFRMTEHRTLDEGSCYGLPAELGLIHGMGAMRGAATGTGVGSLYVFGSRGVSAFDVSAPRSSDGEAQRGWKEIAFSQVAFQGAGTRSPRSIVNVSDDLWYVDANKRLRSVYYDSTQLGKEGYSGSAQFNVDKSFETERWSSRTENSYRPLISAALAGNRLFWTLCGGRALCSLDFAQAYTVAPAEIPPLHEGAWTGFDFRQALALEDVLHAVVAQGSDVHLLRLSESAKTDPGGRSVESVLVTKAYAGAYNEMYWLHQAKKLSHVELIVSAISIDSSISVEYRPLHSTVWTELGSREFHVPSGAPQSRANVRFALNPATMSGCNEATKEPLHVARAFQFRIKWAGRLKIDKFTAFAPLLDEGPRPQCAVDNPGLAAVPEETFDDFDYEVTL